MAIQSQPNCAHVMSDVRQLPDSDGQVEQQCCEAVLEPMRCLWRALGFGHSKNRAQPLALHAQATGSPS